jgi:hypothetical protein
MAPICLPQVTFRGVQLRNNQNSLQKNHPGLSDKCLIAVNKTTSITLVPVLYPFHTYYSMRRHHFFCNELE